MITGLIVGKFCPLHKGHEALIDFARGHCDRLIILSYNKPEIDGFLPERRTAWLAELYPHAISLVLDDDALAGFAERTSTPARTMPANAEPDEAHRAFIAWVCRTMLEHRVDRVFTSEGYGNGFAASLAGHFGHPVAHVAFDPSRAAVPVSGTRLRADATLHRQFLSEPVRRSLIRRAALIGGESSGKTTLAAALADRLGTKWITEYGRELWEQRGGKLAFPDLLAIGREQVRREESARADAEDWLICDTSPLVTLFYSEAMFGRSDPALRALASRHYDLTFLCAPDFEFVQDGTRQDADFRARQHGWYVDELAAAGVTPVILAGPPEQRIEVALKALSVSRL
jgi:NadR type nicotinamide-nucleotide adenylyltransferase